MDTEEGRCEKTTGGRNGVVERDQRQKQKRENINEKTRQELGT